MLASLKISARKRPLVAIIGINNATETTDYLVPTGILRRADVADVAMKSAAGLAKVKLRGRARVDAAFTLALAAYNLIRLPKLLGAAP